ncbi:amidohydrolase family protein [Streptacidiphilus sp. P02-A3a]|uniref:amidohydrolase family protein n=1 Tax=Streptacidiphilus sp. P02-A3a TaxID=2704468 RepID=UPI0015FAD46D|nr:amidohydrolase family protein [Streptacidiphilus sp. P02-A3a]QMU72773.1 amidohydrolase family protein [Streptacidiphilus sp. P02-A3a]
MPSGTPLGAPGATRPLLLAGARLTDGQAVDVLVGGGRIERVAAAGRLEAAERLDLGGYLLLPAPVEPHAHLDEAFGADPDAVDAPETAEAVRRRITEAALLGLGYGAVVQRTQVRIGGARPLARLEAALQAGRSLHGLLELHVVALPGTRPGTLPVGPPGGEGPQQRALLREALSMGAHAVGGCPDLDPDPVGWVRAVTALAAESGSPLDLHTDAVDPVRFGRLLDALAGSPVPVTLGPCPGLGLLTGDELARVADRLARAGISLTCLPQGERCTGTATAAHPARPRLPVGALRAAGVTVAAGSGALRDRSDPVGRPDPLEAAFLLAASGSLDPEAAYQAVSAQARQLLGLPPVRVSPGAPADLLAVRGTDLHGVLSGGHSRIVLHAGRIVSRTSAVREYADADGPAVPRQGHRPGPAR